MRIAIIGGTGALGRRLAAGWRRAGHEVVVGTRDPARRPAELDPAIPLAPHAEAVRGARLIVLSVPGAAAGAAAETVAPHLDPEAVVLSVMVPLRQGDPTSFDAPVEGSLAAHVAARVPKANPVAAGFHTVSAHAAPGDGDVLICGQTAGARKLVLEATHDLGMHGVDCGPLRSAETLERLTPLLIGINRRYKTRGAGIRIGGLGPPASGG